jgi:hypothetical protein
MIPVLLKLDLRHFLSPIRVFVHYHEELLDPNSSYISPRDAEHDNSLIYGSFKNPQPSEADHCDVFHNDHKFKIVSHASRKERFDLEDEEKFFYMSVVSPSDRFITICARSKIPDDDHHGMKKVIVPIMEAKPDICKEAHYRIKEAMTNKVKRDNIINIMHELNALKDGPCHLEIIEQNKNMMHIYPEIKRNQLTF